MSSKPDALDADAGFFARKFPTFKRSLGAFGWPILLRQLRADFRKSRFFLSEAVCLAALALTLISVMSVFAEDESKTAAQVGQALFRFFFIVQYLIILIIFPAFSAAAFTEERAGQTLDLLICSRLRASEIVWGKFLAAAVYCLVYVIATIPLLSISFLFGGIELSEVLAAYGILLGLTLVISMLGITVSSCSSSSTRATILVYALVLTVLGASVLLYFELESYIDARNARTLVGALLDWLAPEGSIALLYMLFFLMVSFAYLFEIAANRIRQAADDKASRLRVLTFVAGTTFLALRTWEMLIETTTARRARLEGDALLLLKTAAIFLIAVAVVFPTEEAAVSRRNRTRFARWSGVLYPLRIFAPGAFWGFVYVIFLSAVVTGGLWLAWEGALRGKSASIDRLAPDFLVLLPLYVGAVAALGFLLAVLDFTPSYARLTLLFFGIITSLLPVIILVSKPGGEPWTDGEVLRSGSYLSPLTIWESLEVPRGHEEEQRFVFLGIHIADAAKALFAATAGAAFVAALIFARRARLPLLTFTRREPRPGAVRRRRGGLARGAD
jgi:ABC-type transport system involved in multi-copper enzyme maturation permease subunit